MTTSTQTHNANPHLKCPRCGDLDGKHIGGCKLRRPIFKSQMLTDADRRYVEAATERFGSNAI